jgi:hypothetical protein
MRCYAHGRDGIAIGAGDHYQRNAAMLDYMAESNQEKAAVLGVFIVSLIFGFLLIGRSLGFRRCWYDPYPWDCEH